MKKVFSVMLAILMVISLTSCAKPLTSSGKKDFKAGFIFLNDENSTYDYNFIESAKEACEYLGVEYVLKTNVPEDESCYEVACELADEGCDIIFADSAGHEEYMIRAAREYSAVQFCHSTGKLAHVENLKNYHNAFASIYEGRYLAGIAAGMKLNEMVLEGDIKQGECKLGYVAAFDNPEVISGYSAFYLGARSECRDVTMDVIYTDSWYDEELEKKAAQKLIEGGCKLISQHADSMSIPETCEELGVPNVAYNRSFADICPNTFIVSSNINWTPYYTMAIRRTSQGRDIPTDYVGNFSTGSVEMTEFGKHAAQGTEKRVNEVKQQLENGTLKVFDLSTFTVNGEILNEYSVDLIPDEENTPDTDVIYYGFFAESDDDFRSAPYFDLPIDGITCLDSE